jgi:hypothetical protein
MSMPTFGRRCESIDELTVAGLPSKPAVDLQTLAASVYCSVPYRFLIAEIGLQQRQVVRGVDLVGVHLYGLQHSVERLLRLSQARKGAPGSATANADPGLFSRATR